MREIHELKIKREDLISILVQAKKVLLFANTDQLKQSICTLISKEFPIENQNSVNHAVKMVLTAWGKHSGEYLYPIPSTKHYSVNPDRTMAQDAALDYLIQSKDFSYWEGEQGILRAEALEFLIFALQLILDMDGLDYILGNPLYPESKYAKGNVTIEEYI